MRQRALISIDMLLDTRYGTLKRIDETIADTLLVSNLYRHRHHDNFDLLTNGQIDREAYHALYAQRDGETLYHARMTDFLYHLRQDFKEGESKLQRGVAIESLGVDVNIWPYDLTLAEQEVVRRSVAHWIPAMAEVNVVNLSPQALTPAYIDNAYEMMAVYNHEDWLGPQTNAVIKHHIPHFVLMTPQIASSGIIPDATKEIRNPFHCRSAALVKFVTLHYVDVYKVCHNPLILQQVYNSKSTAAAPPERPHPPAS